MSYSEPSDTMSIEQEQDNIPSTAGVVCSVQSCSFEQAVPTEGLPWTEWCGLPEYECPGCGGLQERKALGIKDNGDWCHVGEEETNRRLQALLERHEQQHELNAAELIARNVVGTMEEAYEKLHQDAIKAVQAQIERDIFGISPADKEVLRGGPPPAEAIELNGLSFRTGGPIVASDGVGE